jgi:hypothetical protein
MIKGRLTAARARENAAGCSAATAPTPNRTLPKRRRLSWQNPHIGPTYHRTSENCYD